MFFPLERLGLLLGWGGLGLNVFGWGNVRWRRHAANTSAFTPSRFKNAVLYETISHCPVSVILPSKSFAEPRIADNAIRWHLSKQLLLKLIDFLRTEAFE
ncbi:hypothetical protein WM26_24745 [Burkholderia cepacia]|nr:hypothetical protein WL34_10940 [Burkholderia cepacia]KWO08634.1 hypothetical protein WM26_24745 [Burkholderia cepacia]